MARPLTAEQKRVAELQYQAVLAVEAATGFTEAELIGEHLDIEQSPERSIWVRHRQAEPHICLLFTRKTGETQVLLEYAKGEDGHFITAAYSTIQDAAKAFEFAVRVVLDIRKQIDQII